MYAQQQVSQQSAPNVQQAPQLEQTCPQDALGNQAMVQEAGLGADSGGLVDDMFDFALDLLPLAAALPLAARRIDEEAVQAWALRQDPADVVDAMALSMPQVLSAQWPVGLGICLGGAMKGALGLEADLEGDLELVRTSADTVRLKVLSETAVSMATVGAKAGIQGATGEAMAAIGATDKTAIELDLEGRVDGNVQHMLVGALAATVAPASILPLLAASSAADLSQAVAGVDLREHLPIPDIDWESRLRVARTARALASRQLVDALPVDFTELLPALQPYIDALSGALDLSMSAGLEVIMGDMGAGLRGSLTLEGLIQLTTMPMFAEHFDHAALDLLAQTLGGEAQVQLDASLTVGEEQGITLAGDRIRLSVMATRSVGDSSQTDCLDFFASDLVDVVEGLASGEGLSALVAATGFRRTVQLPAPDDLVASVVPALGIAVTDMMGDRSVIAGTNSLLLEGSLVAAQGVMETIAASDIEAPAGMSAVDALRDIHTGLCGLAARAGQLPNWLAPWTDVLAEAAANMQVEAPRLKGRIEVAGGFEATATGVGTVGGGNRGNIGFAVDKALDELEGLSVRETLVGGLFGSSPVAADGVAADGECQQETDHADTGTESASSAKVDPDRAAQ